MVPWGCAKGSGGIWRLRSASAHSHGFHFQLVGDCGVLFAGHFFLRCVFDHCQRVAFGPFFSESVASASGMSGTGAGIGTIIAFELIGYFSDAHQAAPAHSFDPIVIVAGMFPFVAMILVLLLVRNTRATEEIGRAS